MQIKELEDLLGSALFERTARQVRLTSFGDAFREHVTGILRAVDDLSEMARAAKGRLSGRFRIGVIPTIAPYLLPAMIPALTKAYHGLDIEVRETTTSKLLQELAEGRIDTAIVALPVDEPSFSEAPLFDEDFLLVRPKTEAGKPVPDREALRKNRLLLLEEGHCFRDQALSFCNIQSALPRESLDGSSLSTLVQMVGAGLGVTLIPQMAVAVETRSAAVDVVRLKGPQPSRTVGMIWRKTTPLADELSGVAEIVREAAEASRAAKETVSG